MAAGAVRHWLSSLNLPEQYQILLLEAGYDTLTKCEHLNDVVLEQIGIKPVGHRRRILSHLPSAEMEPELFPPVAYDSEEDDREIYDIPPVARKSGVMSMQETFYTNIAEMNEIPRPILPPKKRLSSDVEVEARLGIISPPPVNTRSSQGVFCQSPCSPDSVRTQPKLCVVYPEKRPPIPARRISKEEKTLSVTVDSLLNNNIELFNPGPVQKAPVDVPPVAMSRHILTQRDTITEEDSKSDTVTDHKFSELCASVVTIVGPVHCAESVDVAPKPTACFNSGNAGSVLQADKLNPGLEHELREFLSTAKISVLNKVDAVAVTASSSCGTGVSGVPMRAAAVQPNDTIPVLSVPFNSGSCDGTDVIGECPISSAMSLESDNLQSLKTTVEQTSSGNETSNVRRQEHLDCIYVDVDTDEVASLSPPCEVEHSDDVVYESVEYSTPGEHDKDRKDSWEFQYSPPSFPPPPLPADFAIYDVFEFNTSSISNPEPSSRPNTRTAGISHSADEITKQSDSVKPRPAPRRRQSTTSIVNDMPLAVVEAGFSSALDDYLTQKVISPTSWLDHSPGSFGVTRDASSSEFEPFADRQPAEPSPETVKDISPTNHSSACVDSDGDCRIPAVKNSVLYDFEETPDDVSMSKKIKSIHENAPAKAKTLNARDFKEVTCNLETGN